MSVSPEVLTQLLAATEEVFETMVFKPVSRQDPIADDSVRPKSNVVASVAFAGHRRGLVAFHSSLGTARVIAGAMLGMSAEDINGEMPDAIGEIANMIAGSFRTKLAASEPPCAIAVPTVTIGSDFSTKYMSQSHRVLCPFRMDDESIYVELILTGETS
jgi:chemotaxis protein CheX